jgi:hypothetical protein
LAARSRWLLMSSAISSSPRRAVSRQADVAACWTTIEVAGAAGGWVAGAGGAGVLGRVPPGHLVPRATPAPSSPIARVRIRATSSHAGRLRRGLDGTASSWGLPAGMGDVMADGGSGWSGWNSDTRGRELPRIASTVAWLSSAVVSCFASRWVRAVSSRRNGSTSDCRQSCRCGVDAPACSSSIAGHSPSRYVRAAARVPPVVPPSKRSATRPCRSTSTTTGWYGTPQPAQVRPEGSLASG